MHVYSIGQLLNDGLKLVVLIAGHCNPVHRSGFLQSEPNTPVSESSVAQDWVSLQSNLSQASVGQTRSMFPIV